MKKDYIICAPEYSKSNGVRVLHNLALELEARGYKVYMFSPPVMPEKFHYITKITKRMKRDAVVIYPEVIKGNPLGFKNVVRYVLYYPGKLGGASNYDKNEMIFVYVRNYFEKGDELYVSGIDESIFYKDETIEKDRDCYFVHKNGKWRDVPEFKDMTEITMTYPVKREDLGDLLRRTRTLYSFDKNTIFMEEALMCGCDVKIVTEDGFEDYDNKICREHAAKSDEQLDNFIAKTQRMNSKRIFFSSRFKNVKLKNIKKFFKYRYLRLLLLNNDVIKAQRIWWSSEYALAEKNNIKQKADKKQTILITGSGGFIGKNLKEYLKDKYNLLTPRSAELNLTDKAEVKKYFREHKIDLIIHCATIGGVRGVQDDELTLDCNLSMVQNLIDFKDDCTRIILFGSGAMYDKSRRLHKVNEIDIGRFEPKDLYGLSKLRISEIVESRNDILMLNIFACYGYGEKESRFPTYAITQNIKKEPIVINNNVIFDYLFVEDMVKIVEYFIIHKNRDKIINITPTKSISLLEIAKTVNTISGYESEIVVKTENPNGEYTGDNNLLLQNYPECKFTEMKKGLEKLYNYIKND